MADLPDAPLSREEDYLASIAGQNVEVPPCPRSRKEAYLDAIDTKMDEIEQDIEDLKNNPDVVDIVDTYADLQAYDKTKLTDNDIIRVLNDETHDGESTYYRYSASTQTFTYVGTTKQYTDFVGTDGTTAGQAGLVPAPATTDAGKYLKADGTWDTVSSGPTVVQTTGTSTTDVMSQNAVTQALAGAGGIKTLTAADYNYPTNNPTRVAAWLLDPGIYKIEDPTTFPLYYSTSLSNVSSSGGRARMIIVLHSVNDFKQIITSSLDQDATRVLSLTSNGTIYRNLYLTAANNLTTSQSGYSLLDARQGYVLNNKIVGTTEAATIATTDWVALAGSDPYDYSATITATATIDANTGVVELLNDQPALFATHGFAIGAVSGQTVTIYSIGQPDASVSLKLSIRNL